MFTGIVQARWPVAERIDSDEIATFVFDFDDELSAGLVTGASVAINGTCLTARSIEPFDGGQRVRFDAIAQTLRLTNLGTLQATDVVNIERAARIGDEIGGHLLSGHVMSTVKVLEVNDTAANREVWFECPPGLAEFILDKGFVALNGCSLTIAELRAGAFSVHLIPETRDVTTFGEVQVGDAINLEVDPQTQAVVETVKRVMAAQQSAG